MPIPNKLSDLNNFLFAQMERLDNEDITDEELDKEIKRAKAISNISMSIIENAKTVLDAQKYAVEQGFTNTIDIPMLSLGSVKK